MYPPTGKLTVYLENLVTVASILIILAVSMERFWAVYYPLKTHTSGSKSKAMITMAVIWVTSAAVTSPFLVSRVLLHVYFFYLKSLSHTRGPPPRILSPCEHEV